MTRFLLAALLSLGSFSALATGELDNEASVTNQHLQGTVVVRVDSRDNTAAYLRTDSVIVSPEEAKALAGNGDFKVVQAENMRTELDNTTGASSWYYYYQGYYGNPYYNNCLGWYGANYYPFYSYNYSYYNYYYYSSAYYVPYYGSWAWYR